jgi:tetratricopeptide (TPR) repeat protein
MMTDVILFVLAAMLLLQPAAPDQEIQRIAMEGWRAARAIAPKGGPVDLLGPVNIRLKELDEIGGMKARYADAVIRAAVSAAQEERDELKLMLDHARGLSDLLALTGPPAEWPLPIDEVEGELWFEVDRFTEARDAYERAAKLKPSANAWIGLARASDKLADTPAACRAYQAAASATKGLPTSVELEISIYQLKCR